MTIETVAIDDDTALARWFAPFRETELADWPDSPGWALHEMAAVIRDRTAAASQLFVSRGSDGEVEGSVWLRMPTRENRHVADLRLAVRPLRRRRGIGQVLLEHAEQLAERAGRSTVVVTTDEPVRVAEGSRSARFARLAGYEPALEEARRELRLPVLAERLDSLEAETLRLAGGYHIVTWSGRCPDELVQGRVALARSISTDAPHGQLEREADDVDVERIRRFEKTVEEMDRIAYAAGAVETSSGELVGFTEIGVPRARPEEVYQFDTIVLASHRGHRLGMLLKIANLRVIAERSPLTTRVLTWNAVENDPMIRVNDSLGFELIGLGTVWQKQLGGPHHPPR